VKKTLSGALLLASCAVLLGSWAPASAHEVRKVGSYEFAVGWGEEPAYAGQKNSVQLLLTDTKSGVPVTDLGNTLEVQVSYQGKKMQPLSVEPNFEVGESGTPGDYRAWLFPTRVGRYTFHFTGDVKGQKVDESFTSSPTGFSEVEDSTQVEFPVKDPSLSQVSQRFERELPRVTAAVAAARSDLQGDIGAARIIGFVGIGVGVVGCLVALLALSRKRKEG
jgi:hypothetical protein